MLSEKWEVIRLLIKNQGLYNKLVKVIRALRTDDIITTTLLARQLSITYDEADEILHILVANHILDYFIVVECINDEIKNDVNEIQHYKYFDSLREFNLFTLTPECPLCGCGNKYDINNAKIGFKKVTNGKNGL